jgi:phosphoribosyl-AMP cyclohydrolase
LKVIRLEDLNFEKGGGLIPVVVQENNTKEVLTLAYADREAIAKTLEIGYAHYFRRSHDRVMMKGETSGNLQRVVEIMVDCDEDSIVYLVEQKGPACHLGKRSCFHQKLSGLSSEI